MTGSSTMSVVSKRGNQLLRDFHSTHWNVALELLLRTVCLLVKDGQYPISSFKEPIHFIVFGKKVVPRNNSIRPFKTSGVFLFALKSTKDRIRRK